MRPSCGRRFSAMSSFAMTLMRDTTGFAIARCGASTSRSTPSTRKRTTSRFSNGSMWMSDAFSLTACGEQRVDQADHQRVVVGLEQVLGLGQLVGERRGPAPVEVVGDAARSSRRPARRARAAGVS
jgi:hypothetical protein